MLDNLEKFNNEQIKRIRKRSRNLSQQLHRINSQMDRDKGKFLASGSSGSLLETGNMTRSQSHTNSRINKLEEETKDLTDKITVLRSRSLELITTPSATIGNSYIVIEQQIAELEKRKRAKERERESLIAKFEMELFKDVFDPPAAVPRFK